MAFFRAVGAEASYDRLEKLIRQRLEPGADKAAVDGRIWDLFGEDWTVMYTDLSGFSRRVAEFGIIHFLQTILESQRILIPLIEEHSGILLKVEGDSMLVIYRNVAEALRCALRMQAATAAYNRGREESERILLCVGMGHGRVLRIGDSDVFGAEVNAASKLGEDTARAGEILVTAAVREGLQNTVLPGVTGYADLGKAPPGAAGAYRVEYVLNGER